MSDKTFLVNKKLGLVPFVGISPIWLSLSYHTKNITNGKSIHFIGQPMYNQVLKLLDKSKILQISRELGGERQIKGFKYANWFFMGVGAGVDIMLPNDHHDYYEPGVMVPLYADFRFLIGDQSKVSANLDLRVGAAFPFNNLIGDENFYLRPSLGVRFPINKNKPKQALNVAFTYQLLVDGCHYWDRHSLGATIGFEW